MLMLGWAITIAGGCICLLNFYLSILRYPLHRARGRSQDSYRWVSGVPLLGSLALVIGWAFWTRHQGSRSLDVAAWSIALLDTGGIHWFVAAMAYQGFGSRARSKSRTLVR